MRTIAAHRFAAAHLERVVLVAVIVGIVELLEPLQEFEIVLEAALHQPIDRHDLRETKRETKDDQTKRNGDGATTTENARNE